MTDVPITAIFGLVVIVLIIMVWVAYKLGKSRTDLKWQKNLVKLRGDIAEKQRAGIKGKVTEAFAPFLEGFPFKASECKFIGDPIDYIAFKGLDERDIKGVHFVEVKEGKSKLSKHQNQIKDLIDDLDSDDVTFEEFRFDSENN